MSREEFEKLPHTALIAHLFKFNDELNNYSPISSFVDAEYIGFINGAWYAYREQEKMIDAIKKHVDSFYSESDLWGADSDQALRQIELIQELLK